jgi:hypothetical protein
VRRCPGERFTTKVRGAGLADNNPTLAAGLAAQLKQFQTALRLVGMEYRCVATSVAGFLQQLASGYLPHGYWFYVSGLIPRGKDPRDVDRKLIDRYGISISRQSRARRKAVGIANVHYLRYQHYFVLLATHGHHPFYDDEEKSIRDVRRVPIKFAGHAISVKPGGYLRKAGADCPTVRDPKHRVHVQIGQRQYKQLTGYFLDVARRRSADYVASQLRRLPYEPYAPVRQQLLNLLRRVNRIREAMGRDPVGVEAIRLRRRIVRPFEPLPDDSPGDEVPGDTAVTPTLSAGEISTVSQRPGRLAADSGFVAESPSSYASRRQALDEALLDWVSEHLGDVDNTTE